MLKREQLFARLILGFQDDGIDKNAEIVFPRALIGSVFFVKRHRLRKKNGRRARVIRPFDNLDALAAFALEMRASPVENGMYTVRFSHALDRAVGDAAAALERNRPCNQIFRRDRDADFGDDPRALDLIGTAASSFRVEIERYARPDRHGLLAIRIGVVPVEEAGLCARENHDGQASVLRRRDPKGAAYRGPRPGITGEQSG